MTGSVTPSSTEAVGAAVAAAAAAASAGTAAAVGGALAGAVILVAGVGAYFAIRSRRRARSKVTAVRSLAASEAIALKSEVEAQRELIAQLKAQVSSGNLNAANPMLSSRRMDAAKPMASSSFRAPDVGSIHEQAHADDGAAAAAISAQRTPSVRRSFSFSVIKRPETPLPAGWTEISVAGSQPYWKNMNTGVTTFVRPVSGVNVASSAPAPAPSPEPAPAPTLSSELPLREGWVAMKDNDGNTYYANSELNESSWERPV